MNIVRANLLINRIDNMVVNEDDKEEWFRNPCMAAYLKLCLDCMTDSHKEMMQAKNMNDVCEARGAYRTFTALIQELSRIRATSSGGIDESEAAAIKRQIEEIVNESRDRDRDDDTSTRGTGDPDDH